MTEFYNVSLSLLHISRNFDSSKMVFLSSSGNSKDVKSYRNRIKNSLVISSGSMSDVLSDSAFFRKFRTSEMSVK